MVILFLVVVLILFFIVDVEVTEFVRRLSVGDHSEPVAKVVLLQVSFGQVLEVPLGERNIRIDGDLALGQLSGDVSAQIANLVVQLDVLLQVGIKVGSVHDAILNWVSAVDSELEVNFLDFTGLALDLDRLNFLDLWFLGLNSSLKSSSFLGYWFLASAGFLAAASAAGAALTAGAATASFLAAGAAAASALRLAG